MAFTDKCFKFAASHTGGFISGIIWLLFGKNTHVRKKAHSQSKVRSKGQIYKSELFHKMFPFCAYYVLDFVLTLENTHLWYRSYMLLRPSCCSSILSQMHVY